jgi:Domain of unknown function (DUF4190)
MTDLPGDKPQDPQDWRPQSWRPPQEQPDTRQWQPPPGMYQPYGPPPPGYPVYVPQPPFNTYAILALVLGIMVLPPLGIYFGNKAKEQIWVSGERGIEMAKAGVIVGWILTIVYGLFFVVWCCLFAQFFSASTNR